MTGTVLPTRGCPFAPAQRQKARVVAYGQRITALAVLWDTEVVSSSRLCQEQNSHRIAALVSRPLCHHPLALEKIVFVIFLKWQGHNFQEF